MTTIKTTNRPIFDAASKLAILDVKDARGRIELYLALESAGATEKSLTVGGAHSAEFRAGVITGWQGAAFLKRYTKAHASGSGETLVKGKVLERATGLMVDTEKARRDWDTQVPAKIKTARLAYLTWVDLKSAPADAVTGDAVTGDAAKAGKGSGGAGTGGKGTGGNTRDINTRLLDELTKLRTAATDEKRGKDLACDRAELVAYLTRAIDLISKK